MPKFARARLVFILGLSLVCATPGCGDASATGTESHPTGNVDWQKLDRIAAPHGEGSRLTTLPASVLVPALLKDVSQVSGLSAPRAVPMVEVDAEQHLAHVDELAQRENENLTLQSLFLGSEAAFAALGVDRRLAGDAPEQLEAALADGVANEDALIAPPVLQGFYDPSEKTFFIDVHVRPEERLEVIRHELMHALQDHHFNLASRFEAALPDLDRVLAYQSVVEGMADMAALYAARVRNDHFLLLPASRDRSTPRLRPRGRAAYGRTRLPLGLLPARPVAPFGPSLGSASELPPLSMTQFPYEAGDRFFATLLQSVSYRHISFAQWVQEAFAFMPHSTHEVLHPMEWAAARGEPPREQLKLTALQRVPDHPLQWDSALGEMVAQAYLFGRPHGNAVAAAMTRDRVAVLQQPASTLPVVAWVTEWEDEATAQIVYDAAQDIQREIMRARRKNGATPGHTFIRREQKRVGVVVDIARDSGHPRADIEHQHLLASALQAALLEP